MTDLFQRIGIIKITREVIQSNPESIIEILKDVLIVDVVNDFPTNALIYKGYSKHFDLIETGEEIPIYIAKVNTIAKPWIVTWHREKEYSENDVKAILAKILKEVEVGRNY